MRASRPEPPRLCDDPRLGPTVQAAQRPLEPARLRASEDAVGRKLAAIANGSAPLPVDAQSPLRRLLGWLWLPLLVAAVALVVTSARQQTPQRSALRRPTPQVGRGTTEHAAKLPPAPLPRTKSPAIVERPVPGPPVSRPVSARAHPGRRGPPEGSRQTKSTLADQLRLFRAGRSAAAAGDHRRALTLHGELLRRYPASALRAEVELCRADYLLRSGKLAAATVDVRRLLRQPQHRGRRGELYRVLGDLLRRQGRCDRAIDAYRLAETRATSAAQRRAVALGLRGCAAASKAKGKTPSAGSGRFPEGRSHLRESSPRSATTSREERRR